MGRASDNVVDIDPYNKIQFYYKDDSNSWSLEFKFDIK